MARANSSPARVTKRVAINLWVSAASLLAHAARKLRSEPKNAKVTPTHQMKRLLTVFSQKTIRFGRKKRDDRKELEMDMDDCDEKQQSGLWQRSILMGEKCEPLDFSGVIYYDSNGKQLDELPMRSPRASPLPGYLCNSAARRERGLF